jgi:hypothetical protein
MSLHPSDGARFLLELESVDPSGGARYRGAIFTPSERIDYAVSVAASGDLTLAPVAEVPEGLPPRALDLLRNIARSVGKAALAESPPAWPRRVLRWKKLG